MAFPASPLDGQLYVHPITKAHYRWSDTYGCWRLYHDPQHEDATRDHDDLDALYAMTGAVNVETLTADKTLEDGDPELQLLSLGGGVSPDLTLPAAPAKSRRFVVFNLSSGDNYRYLIVKDGTTTLDRVYWGGYKVFVWDDDSGEWVSAFFGSADSNAGVQIGYLANGYDLGIAIGRQASASNGGVGVGSYSGGAGVALGQGAYAGASSVAIGQQADSNLTNKQSVAIGNYAECVRTGEMRHNITGDSTEKACWTVPSWYGETTDGTETEIMCGGESGKRFTIEASSAYVFHLHAVARASGGDVKAWTIDGCIKRDGSGNTSLVGTPTVTVIGNDAGASAWDIAVEADDASEALIVKVTGAAATTIHWAVSGLPTEVF